MGKTIKRTKQELAKDVSTILMLDLHPETKRIIIDNALWNWSGYDGKTKGCRFWTNQAWAQREDGRKLRHEHLVPRKVLIEELMRSEYRTEDQVFQFMEEFCVGVVVTLIEDKILNEKGFKSSMPPDWDKEDPWARYRHAGLFEDVTEPNK